MDEDNLLTFLVLILIKRLAENIELIVKNLRIAHTGSSIEQFMRMKVTPLQSEAMQKVMSDYPELFGKAKPQEKPRQIDTGEARRIATNALQQQGLLTQAAYNVNGLGDYLHVFPADRKGAHVLLHNDGRIARIFTPEQI